MHDLIFPSWATDSNNFFNQTKYRQELSPCFRPSLCFDIPWIPCRLTHSKLLFLSAASFMASKRLVFCGTVSSWLNVLLMSGPTQSHSVNVMGTGGAVVSVGGGTVTGASVGVAPSVDRTAR